MADEPLGGTGQPPSSYHTERLGRYLLRREIGRGFSSVVFEAVDLTRQRTVALKVLTFLQNLSPERRGDLQERFAREARAISALSHPGIVAIYEVGHAEDGREFIAMELLPGETLRARLHRERALPVGDAVPIALQIADALRYAHERGIIHRDVKPDNVFLLPNGRVKLMDFGVAHVSSDEALTQAGTVVGSPAYMSPEQINGEHLDGRSDVFSLGVMLAEMVVGHKPFDAATIPAVMHRILTRRPQIEAVSPRALRRIIEKSLSKNRQARFRSATALADALRRQVLPDLPLWEPTSTLLMPLPAARDSAGRGLAGEWEILHENRFLSRPARWGIAAVLLGLSSLGAAYLSAPLPPRDRPIPNQQVILSAVPANAGIVRHIPAYWHRLPLDAARRPGEVRTVPSAPRATSLARTVDGMTRMRSATPVAMHPPSKPLAFTPRTAAVSANRSTSRNPQLAVTDTARVVSVHTVPGLFVSVPRIPIVKIGGFRQEQTFTPPVIPPNHPPSLSDQDSERIDATDAPIGPPSASDAPASEPHLLHRTAPVYPQAAWAVDVEGTTTLRVFVDRDGTVTGATVIESAGTPSLDKAALRAVRTWEFEPAFVGGQPVGSQVTERVTFSR